MRLTHANAGTGQWRWRESNPRPVAKNQGFSGRSLSALFSALTLTQARREQAQSSRSPGSPDDEDYQQWLSS